MILMHVICKTVMMETNGVHNLLQQLPEEVLSTLER